MRVESRQRWRATQHFWQAAHVLDGSVQDESSWQVPVKAIWANCSVMLGWRTLRRLSSPCPSNTPASMSGGSPTYLGLAPQEIRPGLDTPDKSQLREQCRQLLPNAPFTLTAGAWAARPGLTLPIHRTITYRRLRGRHRNWMTSAQPATAAPMSAY